MSVKLRGANGANCRLILSRDCLPFIGRYRRVEGFDIDPTELLAAFPKSG
ncbi:MAG: hypothetical protein ABW164_04750 [Sphingobium sp.]